MPKNWEPGIKLWFLKDTIDEHSEDCIASVIYSDEVDLTQMKIYRASKRIGTFGALDRMYDYYDNCLKRIVDFPVSFYSDFGGSDPDDDEDGLTNWEEYELGTDWNNPDTDSDGILDIDEITEQSVVSWLYFEDIDAISRAEIQIKTSGKAEKNIKIGVPKGYEGLDDNILGQVGITVAIKSDSYFDSARITLFYTETYLNDIDENDLVILWRNKETGVFSLAETVVDTEHQSASIEVPGFEYAEFILADSTYAKEWTDILSE